MYVRDMPDVHPTALIASSARLAADVSVGPFTVVHEDVEIGAGSRIGSHCSIGEPTPNAEGRALVIGAGAHIRSHSVVYQGSTFGSGLTTGHHVTMREGLVTGLGLQVGTLSDLQGRATIGDYVRLHSNVHIGQLSRIGSFVWIFPYVVLTNDPHPPSDGHHAGVKVEDFAVIATMSTVLPGVRIGARSVIAAHALVRRDVEPDTLVAGVPAKSLGAASRVQLSDGSGPAYPWTRHFHRGYPPELVSEWSAAQGPESAS
ncbi:MAG: hypothetical protein JWP11_1152 [Frankiales bacterium]|nr:hypothetical protein [Frankiales bacterium]